jgi:hypothetical protein
MFGRPHWDLYCKEFTETCPNALTPGEIKIWRYERLEDVGTEPTDVKCVWLSICMEYTNARLHSSMYCEHTGNFRTCDDLTIFGERL